MKVTEATVTIAVAQKNFKPKNIIGSVNILKNNKNTVHATIAKNSNRISSGARRLLRIAKR
jgi:hypothetical protein